MLVDGNWIEVPNYTIEYRALAGDTGETGGAHWCGRAYQKVDNSVFHVTQCAVLPPNAADLATPPLALDQSSIWSAPTAGSGWEVSGVPLERHSRDVKPRAPVLP